MKILISYGFRNPYPPIGVFCYKAFKKLGCKVDIFNSRIENPILKKINKLSKKIDWKITKLDHKERINNLLMQRVSKLKPDILLEIGGHFLYPGTLKWLRESYPTKLVLWATERSSDVEDKNFFTELTAYDYIFSTANYAVKILKERGIKNIHYLPFATDIDFYKKTKLSNKDLNKYNCDIGFIGAYDENREKILKNLMHFNLNIWGTGWNRLSDERFNLFVKGNSGLYGKNVVKFYNTAKINLSIIQEKYKLYLSGLDLRTFDIPACQAFLITQYVDEIPQAFEIGREIEVFNSPEELTDKIKFYLRNDAKRREIARMGYLRICENHTFKKRAQEMLSLLNLHIQR